MDDVTQARSESEDQQSKEADDAEEDIPLSDLDSLGSEEKGDIIPHQRLSINNHAALNKAYKSIALPYSKLQFSDHMSTTTTDAVQIADINDDLNRELAFYKQSLEAVNHARPRLKKESVPFSRPVDYFAEMVKSDEHMGKIKQKLVDEAAGRKAAADARKQRDLKKFGKQVQIAKQQERAKEKRDTMEKINVLKRSRYPPISLRECPFPTICYTSKWLILIDTQNDRMLEWMRSTNLNCLMLPWRMQQRRIGKNELRVRRWPAEANRTPSGRRGTRSMDLAVRRDMRRATMRTRRTI